MLAVDVTRRDIRHPLPTEREMPVDDAHAARPADMLQGKIGGNVTINP